MRIVLLSVGLLMAGCSAALIPGSKVPDTPENHAVFDVVEAYRLAMENRDSERLKQLVSMRYYENASSTNKDEDDYGFEALEGKVLPELQDNVKKIQYRIVVNSIVVSGNHAQAEYEYFWKFLYTEGGRESWKERNDFNRLDFEREGGVWKIAAGL